MNVPEDKAGPTSGSAGDLEEIRVLKYTGRDPGRLLGEIEEFLDPGDSALIQLDRHYPASLDSSSYRIMMERLSEMIKALINSAYILTRTMDIIARAITSSFPRSIFSLYTITERMMGITKEVENIGCIRVKGPVAKALSTRKYPQKFRVPAAAPKINSER